MDKKVVSSLFTSDIFIIAPLPEKGKFFLPCVLPTTSNLENIRSSFSKVTDALVLTWNMKPIPQGIFPALAVNLVNRKKSPKFDFIDLKHQRNYYNIVMLSIYCAFI